MVLRAVPLGAAPRPLRPDVLRLAFLTGQDVEDVRRQQERVDGVADQAVLSAGVFLAKISYYTKKQNEL